MLDKIATIIYNYRSWIKVQLFIFKRIGYLLALSNKRTLKRRNNNMKKIVTIALIFGLSLIISACAVSHGHALFQTKQTFEQRLTSLEESPSRFSDWVADQIIEQRLKTITIDYDCFSLPSCRAQVVRVKKSLPDIKIRIYVNAMELFERSRELNQRPVQQKIAQTVKANYPNYYLRDINGHRIQYWQQYEMYMMNLSSQCPEYNDKPWSEFLVDSLYEQVYRPNARLIDGIEIDNMWPYVSWINEFRNVQIDLNNDGQPEDYWTLDYYWRQGMFHLIDSIRHKFPAGFIVTGRGFHYRYNSRLDGLTFEHIFKHGEDGIQGGNFSKVDRWIRLSQAGKYYTWNAIQKQQTHNITQYVISLLGDGYFALDGGDTGHGEFSTFPGYVDLGQSIGPARYPYQVVFDSDQSLLGLQGDYTPQANNWLRLDNGQTIAINAKKGQQVQFYYQILSGQYCASEIKFTYPGMPEKDEKQFDAHRWQDGEYYALATEDGAFAWSYTGPGYALLTHIVIRDTNLGKPYFMRQYEKGYVYYNPGDQPIYLEFPGQGVVELKSGQGKILLSQ
ncbi:MAG: hypothetical protein GF365_00305 [Candidatus Buchananbacteria bacterium]|nr:hypothetical protein [Candidatus Buchananbacteria bacterium]